MHVYMYAYMIHHIYRARKKRAYYLALWSAQTYTHTAYVYVHANYVTRQPHTHVLPSTLVCHARTSYISALHSH